MGVADRENLGEFGRVRKCFSLTAAGRDSVEHSAVMLKRMMQGIVLLPESRQRT